MNELEIETTVTSENIAEISRALRKEKGMTQKEFAKFTGYCQTSVSHWEEASGPKTRDFVDIANACGYDVILRRVKEQNNEVWT